MLRSLITTRSWHLWDYAKTDGIAALQEEAKVQQLSIDSVDIISADDEDKIDDKAEDWILMTETQPTVLIGEDSTASKRRNSVYLEILQVKMNRLSHRYLQGLVNLKRDQRDLMTLN